MVELPSGTVTFLFTDLEGSTRLWEADQDGMAAAVARHHELLDGVVRQHGGTVFVNLGDGVGAAFPTARGAVAAGVDAQLALADEPWGSTGPLLARMGIHTGEGRVIGDNYESHTLNRCARLMAAAHGGQLVISGATAELVRGDLPPDVGLVDLGEHRLRDLQSPMRVFQVTHPRLGTEFDPLRSLEPADHLPPGNLPTSLDRFVGRARELREIAESLADTRLLTLLGPGGTGKTRLAVEAAAERRPDLDDRVYFVDLSGCRDVDAVLSVTARTVGVHDSSNRPLLAAIEEQIAGQPVLLVMDNFEQVTAAALTVAELLRTCPDLTVVVTSREALNVTGERVYAVPPLALPADLGHPSVAELGESEAVQLFVERARAVRADFELTAENATAVLELCRRLDGLPLAIELATARLALLSPQALVERIADRLDLLTGGARDAPDRHRALRATISWSYDLLTGDEQRLLALLAVFSGATVEAIETVARHVQDLDGIDVLDALSSLVDKSLVRQVEAGPADTRLSMLTTIRAFAAEQLGADPDRLAAARRAHAEYFADWTLEHCEKLTGDDRDAAAARMAADIANLNAAWRYWLDEGDFEELGKLTDGLWLLYNVRGWYHQTATLITDLLGVLSSTPSSEERRLQQILLQTSLARVLLASQGYTAETERAYQRALELCEAQGEFPQLLPVLRGLSTFYVYRAEFERSARIGEQLLALAERFDDARARVEGHLVVGVSEGMLSRLESGIDHLAQGIEAYEDTPRTVERFEAGNDPGVVCRIVEGMLLWMRGFPDRARELAYAAIELAERMHHPQSIAYAQFHTGLIHLWLREDDRAATHAREVIEIAAAYEFPVWTAAGSCLHGTAVTATGAVDDGLAQFEDAMEQYRALKSPPVFLPSLLQFHALILGRAGRPGEGLALVDQALAVVAGLPEPQTLASELHVLHGMLLLADSDDTAGAESCFLRAVQNADELDAPMLQLRATMPLAELWGAQGNVDPARAQLGTAYARLTEGFATADLVDARRLLDELAAAAPRPGLE